MKQIAILALWILAPLIVPVMGETIDGTMNLTHRPALKLSEALNIGTKALEGDAKSFSCTIAKSKTSSSGGGWDLQFRSRTLPFRWISIDKSGKVTSNRDRPDLVANIKAPPRLAMERAIEIAVATRDKPRKWHPVYAHWDEEKDEWYLVIVNLNRDAVNFFVDSNGKAREQKQ